MKKNILRRHNFLVEVTFEGQFSLNILEDYLGSRKQRTKVGHFYSSWKAIRSGVPQGSIIGPRVFNIFMCGMFLILKGTYFTDYVDHDTPFVVRDNIKDVIKALEEIGENLVNQFLNNEMKLNTDKCHLLLNSEKPNTLKIGDLHWNKPRETSEITKFFNLL